jgi:hypothetical protein
MIKDFTPARASLASGVVIKQTLLERNKYPQPEVNGLDTIIRVQLKWLLLRVVQVVLLINIMV